MDICYNRANNFYYYVSLDYTFKKENKTTKKSQLNLRKEKNYVTSHICK